MKRRIKFIISAALFAAIILLFFLPVYRSGKLSISLIQFVGDYLNNENSLGELALSKYVSLQIAAYNEFFVVLVLGAGIFGFILSLLIALVPKNKAAGIIAFVGFVGLIISFLVANNLFLLFSAAKASIDELLARVNLAIMLSIGGLFFVATVFNFVVSMIKEPIRYKKSKKKAGKVTEFLFKHKKPGSTSARLRALRFPDNHEQDDDSTVISDADVVD